MSDQVSQLPGRNDVARVFVLFETMHLIRAFEIAADQAWRDGYVKGSVHQYIGEEAIATAVCANLRPDDVLASYHRGHGHSIAKGTDPEGMMKELFGRSDGTSHGKGGSMHIADFSLGVMGANGVVGESTTLACGAAKAFRLKGQDRIAVAFFGDGAINRGVTLEAWNWAKIYRLPVLFVCEDNEFAVTVRTATVTAGAGALARAQAFGLHAVSIDGNDLLEVDRTAAKLIPRVRAGEPCFVHARTYRLFGHVSFQPDTYRDPAEVEARKAFEPIRRTARWLLDHGVSQAEIDDVENAARERIEAAVRAAHDAPWPDESALLTDVQDLEMQA
jgi:pyruvate dehydrogenase E1 component alpha subunit